MKLLSIQDEAANLSIDTDSLQQEAASPLETQRTPTLKSRIQRIPTFNVVTPSENK